MLSWDELNTEEHTPPLAPVQPATIEQAQEVMQNATAKLVLQGRVLRCIF